MHINGAGLREQLAACAERSRSAGLHRVHAALRQELIDLEGPAGPTPAEPAAPVRTQRRYRGQPVQDEEKPSSTGESDTAPTRRVIYRNSLA